MIYPLSYYYLIQNIAKTALDHSEKGLTEKHSGLLARENLSLKEQFNWKAKPWAVESTCVKIKSKFNVL